MFPRGDMSASYYLEVLGAGIAAYFVYLYLSQSRSRLPPGPKPLPLIGNVLDIPTSDEYKTYTKWGKEYGDVVHVNALGKHIIVLNSIEAASELLNTRSATSSNRPYSPMFHDPDLMDASWSLGAMQNTPEWKRQRRILAQYFNPAALRAYFEVQTSSAHTLLRQVLNTPEELSGHIHHAVGESLLSIAYGYTAQPKNDPLIGLSEYVTSTTGQGAIPGRFLVNMLPWLKYVPAWVPGAGFKVLAKEAREAGERIREVPYEDSKRRFEEGTILPSFVTSALEDPSPIFLPADIKGLAASMYGAGADTTISTVHSCILGMVLHPEVQVRAQAELDTVLGLATSPMFRLPTLSDRPRLPYIQAIVNEGLRWMPPVPLGVPHEATEKDEYRGWHIPKGAILIANAWSMLHDEKTYRDPFEFWPERFLGENPEPEPISQGCFGWGRRECPGSRIAGTSLWILVASMLAAFTISPAKDEHGQDIDVRYACEPHVGLTLQPQKFPCKIVPRSKEAEMRINETHPDGG